MTLFAVLRAAGPAWDPARTRPEQDGWEEHATFMNGLVEERFVLLGGPVTPTEALLAVDAADESEIDRRLADDPWARSETLVTARLHRWEILLGAPPWAGVGG